MATLTVNFTKPNTIKKSYDLKKYDTVKIVTDGNSDFINGIDSAKASGNTLTIKAMGKTITFKNINSDIRITAFGLGAEYYNESFETFYFAPEFGNTEKTWLAKTSSTSVTGTAFGETINLSGEGVYVPTAKNLKKNIGVAINAGKGDDKIYGTKYNDTITGGKGENTVYLSSSDFGNDIIKLTKGETLDIQLNGASLSDSMPYSVGKNKNDLLVTAVEGTLTLKNYYTKDTGATVNINGHDLSKEALLGEVNATNHFEIEGKKVNAKYTGTALADEINASGLTKATGKNNKGVTINSGLGYDIITGSDFNDKITGGKGTNIINVYTTKNFGDDEVVLTKGENLKIQLDDFEYSELEDKNVYQYVKVEFLKNDLKISVYSSPFSYEGGLPKYDEDKKTGTITVKNYTKKDVLTSSGSFIITDKNGDCEYNIREDYRDVYLTDAKHSKYNASWIMEQVNAEDLKLYKKGQEITTSTNGFEKVKGATVNLNSCPEDTNNHFVGSIYADKVKGGNGSDWVDSSLGNDTYTLGAGENYINYRDKYSNDTIYLTKGEKLILDFVHNTNAPTYSQGTGKNKNDLIITTDDGTVTLKNYYGKDLGADVVINYLKDGWNTVNLKEDSIFTFNENDIKKGALTTSALSDKISINLEEPIKTVKGVDYGVTINSGSGNDDITGSDYNDTIKAGKGNDTINAGKGNNLIYLYKGDGVDTIENGGGEDTLVFAKNTKLNLAQQNKDDLVISYGDSDKVTLKDFYTLGNSVKYIKIGNTKTDILTLAPECAVIDYVEDNVHYYLGTENDDEITPNDDYNAEVYGFGGSDTVTLNNQLADVYLGKGSDTVVINGSGGSATIHFVEGDGENTLRYTEEGKSKDVFLDFDGNDIKGTKNENNLVVKYGENYSDSLIIEDYYEKSLNRIWIDGESTVNINTLPVYVEGTEGNDTLSNDTKNQTYIYAGKGSDIINATNNVNTSIFLSESDGSKTVNWTRRNYDLKIYFDETSLYNNSKLIKNGNNLEIQYSSNATDKVIFTDFFTKSESDQTTYTQNIKLFFGKQSDEGYKTGTLYSFLTDFGYDTLYGYTITGEGTITGTNFSDRIIGSDSSDTIITGTGQDKIFVNKGIDTVNIDGKGRKDIYFNTDDGDLTVNFNAAKDDINNIIALHIEGITSVSENNLKFYHSYNDLLIKNPNSNGGYDTITVKDYYTNENIPTGDKFKVYYDGDVDYTTLSAFIMKRGLTVDGTDGIDNITVQQGHNAIYAGKGDDNKTIQAGGNNGLNNIYISKGDGNDTVIFDTTGSGNRIWTKFYFDAGTTFDFEKSGNDLLINHTTDDLKETLTIKDMDYDCANYRQIYVGGEEFELGGVLSNLLNNSKYGIVINGSGVGVNKFKNKFYGTDEADTITVGYGGDSVVDLKKGDDTIIFSGNGSNVATGNDKLYSHNGDGNDTMRFNNDSFSSALNLYFDEDASITTAKDGDNLLIKRNYTDTNSVVQTETLTLEHYLSKQYNENLWINIGSGSSVIKTYINYPDNVGISGSNIGYIIGNNGDNTYTIQNTTQSYVNGMAGNDTYDVYMNNTANTYIEDSAGSDILNIKNKAHSELHIAFNIAKGGSSIIEDSLMILDDTNFDKWQSNINDETIKGIKIGGTDITAIETIKAKDNYYLSSTQLDTLKSSVATWLSTANDGAGYTDLNAAFTSAEKETLIAYIGTQTQWQQN